jgi:hypothetical protein
MAKKVAKKRAVKKAAKRAAKKTTAKRKTRKRPPPASEDLVALFPGYKKEPYKERSVRQKEKLLGELREAYLHRGLVVYVGAGVSRSLGLPSWDELIRSLTVSMMRRRVGAAIQSPEKMGVDQYFKTLQTIQDAVETAADYDKPVLMMARAIKDELQEELPLLVAGTLYRHPWFRHYWRRREGPKPDRRNVRLPSSPLLDSLVALARAERDVRGVIAIINYNYDDLLDERLREDKVRCVTVRSGQDRLPSRAVPSYHVHGVLPFRDVARMRRLRKATNIGNFVFSEDEYHQEYSEPYRWSNMTQMSFLGRHVGLFVGLSLEDPNIRRLIDVTHRQYPDVPNYAILPRKTALSDRADTKAGVLKNLFEEVETKSFEKIGVRVIWADNYKEVPGLVYRICQEERVATPALVATTRGC